jgi:hypothetical protein
MTNLSDFELLHDCRICGARFLTRNLSEEICRECRGGGGKSEKKRARLRNMPQPGRLSPREARRLRTIMSTTIRRKLLINQSLIKVGFFYCLGKDYQPENMLSIPFDVKKGGPFPIRRQKDGVISHFALRRGWLRIVISGEIYDLAA